MDRNHVEPASDAVHESSRQSLRRRGRGGRSFLKREAILRYRELVGFLENSRFCLGKEFNMRTILSRNLPRLFALLALTLIPATGLRGQSFFKRADVNVDGEVNIGDPVATLGFLCGPFWDPRDAAATGRALLHFWLECTRLGLSIHPYGNLVTNRPTAARVRAETGLEDPWLVFKIGRSAAPPASRRRAVEEILA